STCHVHPSRPSIQPAGPAERLERAWLCVLYEPGQPQGSGAGSQSSRGPRHLLARGRPPGPRRRPGEPAVPAGGRRLLGDETRGEPGRRLGVAAEPRYRKPGVAGGDVLGNAGALGWWADPAAVLLGRLPGPAGLDRILGAPAEPAPRPAPIHAAPRRLDSGGARTE